MRGELVLFLSNISWDFLWQRHQELARRFAAAGNRVVYVEPIGIRMPKWEDRKRIAARLANRRAAGERHLREVEQSVWVHDPLVIPFQQVVWVHRRNVRSLRDALIQTIARLGASSPLIWSYVPTPLAVDVIRQLPHKAVVYDCVDALALNPKGVFREYGASEQTMSRMADAVFVTSQALYERQRSLNPRTFLVPNGVDYDKFSIPAPLVPSDLASIPTPRLGFFGGIDERVDLELMQTMARRHPEWSLVMIGVERTNVTALRSAPNVHFLGVKLHDALPAYLHHLDVLLMPYRLTEYTRYMYPAKLNECLAVGKPTIATPLPEFEPFRDVMYLAGSPVEFERAVQKALEEGMDAQRINARRARARAATWEARFEEIQARLDQVLGGEPTAASLEPLQMPRGTHAAQHLG